MQLLQSQIIITYAGRDNAVCSVSDCRLMGHKFEPKPCNIINVKAYHKITPTDTRSIYTCALVLGGLLLPNTSDWLDMIFIVLSEA